ncbi:hypothetical protein CRE_18279 [Caenorhabditis remanei]|uniref:G-protein coupled receptors family 1 profile domain-containing protein n=1 Tax=Caenorhabditis remanei TaxID=31234 RepID=E3NKE8_CAERE|nr:hypothetical protein CRE_18279 [Caenorhabditis remanei]
MAGFNYPRLKMTKKPRIYTTTSLPASEIPIQPDYDSDMEFYNKISMACAMIDLILQSLTIFVNIIHLSVLSQKELRGLSIYLIMIWIALLDTTNFCIWVFNNLDMFFRMLSIPGTPCLSYDFTEFTAYNFFTTEANFISQRLSTLLSLLMALTRTLSVRFPMNNLVQSMTSCKMTLRVMVLLLLLFMGISFWPLMSLKKLWLPDYVNPSCTLSPAELNATGYVWAFPKSVTNAIEFSTIFDKLFMKFLPAIGYPILTILLIMELIKVKKRRSKMQNNESKDNTTGLILFMTISFMLSEGTAAVQGILIYNHEWFDDEEVVNAIAFSSYPIYNLRSLNAFSHFFVCYFLSSQYRDTLYRIMCCCQEKSKRNKVSLMKISLLFNLELQLTIAQSSTSNSTTK